MTDQTLLYCVGATKAGTSWLYRMLHGHPECLVRDVKEAHYWDTFDAKRCAGQLSAFAANHSKMLETREMVRRNGNKHREANLTCQIDDMVGLVDVLESPREDDARYWAWLSNGGEGKRVVAEMTPAYGLLDEAMLTRMAALRPMTKFVYLIRDPLDRLWSHIRMVVSRQHGDADLEARANHAMAKVIAGQKHADVAERGDYRSTIEKLRRVVPASRLLVEFSERLMTADGWARVCAFLGLTHIAADKERKVHEGAKARMDAGLAADAVRFLKDQYDWVADNVGPLPQNWQNNLARAYA